MQLVLARQGTRVGKRQVQSGLEIVCVGQQKDGRVHLQVKVPHGVGGAVLGQSRQHQEVRLAQLVAQINGATSALLDDVESLGMWDRRPSIQIPDSDLFISISQERI